MNKKELKELKKELERRIEVLTNKLQGSDYQEGISDGYRYVLNELDKE